MVVKRQDFEVRATLDQIEGIIAQTAPAGDPDPIDREIEALLKDISRETIALNDKVISAVRLLSEKGAWCETVRLLVGVGGYQSAEIADALGVMRSTVTRWYNGETMPQQAQVGVYFKRLIEFMKETRPFILHVSAKDLVRP